MLADALSAAVTLGFILFLGWLIILATRDVG